MASMEKVRPMSSILVYSRDNCFYCEQAKALLHSKDQRFQEMKIGVDITREEFMSTFPNVTSVPFIIINGERIGGFDKLTEWYNGNGQQFLSE
jgi:glutaredoxin 3